jgi:hypothetical protein
MATATAVVVNDRPSGHMFSGTFTLDPGSLTTGTGEVETVTVPGIAAGDVATVCPQSALTAGLVVSYVRTAANTITFAIWNATAGTVDLASGTWNFTVFRGSTMGLR